MARYTESQCRICRREGQKLYLKGDRCYSKNCSFDKRPAPPGQHGKANRRKASNYGLQLREKHKMRRMYGVLEGQFRKYFAMAEKMDGVVGENFLSLLERRLDNTVYRMGFAASRAQARQLVNHGHFLVNVHKVDIPSYLVSLGDVITVKETSNGIAIFKDVKEGAKKTVPAWLVVENDKLTATVKALPTKGDLDITIEEHLIVEWYSK